MITGMSTAAEVARMWPPEYEKHDDGVYAFFTSLCYSVMEDWKRRTGEHWYEIYEKGGDLVMQVDCGIPVAHIIEDLKCMCKGKPGTSASDYTINAKEHDPSFQLLLNVVAMSRVQGELSL